MVSLKGWEKRVGGFTEGRGKEATGHGAPPNPSSRLHRLYPRALSTSPHYLPRAESNILGKVKPHEPSINPLQINTQCKKQTF